MTLTEIRVADINPVDYAIATGQTSQIDWQNLTNREIFFFSRIPKTGVKECLSKASEEIKKRIDVFFSSPHTLGDITSRMDNNFYLPFDHSCIMRYFPELLDTLVEKIDPLVITAITSASKEEDLSRLHNFVQKGSEISKLLNEKRNQLVNSVLSKKIRLRITNKDFAISNKESTWLNSSEAIEKTIGKEFFNAFIENIGTMSFGELKMCQFAVDNCARSAYLNRLFEIVPFERMDVEFEDHQYRLSKMEKNDIILIIIKRAKNLDELEKIWRRGIRSDETNPSLIKKAISLVREPSDVAKLSTFEISIEKRIDILRQLETAPTPKG